MTKASLVSAVIEYGKDRYGVDPDHPFEKYPDYFALRHKRNKKWFALVTDVPKSKLGLDGEDQVEIINLKCDPDMIGSLRKRPGFFPAYHMNKEHWLTVILDGTVEFNEISHLIDQSYALSQ